jgi:hypothetical protein
LDSVCSKVESLEDMYWVIEMPARTDYTAADSSATLRFRCIADACIVEVEES